jgi:hypothetical protein
VTSERESAAAELLRAVLAGGDEAAWIESLAESWDRPLAHTVAMLLRRGLRDAMAMGVCRDCGCSDSDACESDDGACYWAAEDLCSACCERTLQAESGE